MNFHVGSYLLGVLTPFILLGVAAVIHEVWKL